MTGEQQVQAIREWYAREYSENLFMNRNEVRRLLGYIAELERKRDDGLSSNSELVVRHHPV